MKSYKNEKIKLQKMALNAGADYLCDTMKRFISFTSPLRRYFTEKNALTVTASLFCFIMMIVSFGKQTWWECIAFALAFSFSIEVICHRAKENK
jgi:hypothetical protein